MLSWELVLAWDLYGWDLFHVLKISADVKVGGLESHPFEIDQAREKLSPDHS